MSQSTRVYGGLDYDGTATLPIASPESAFENYDSATGRVRTFMRVFNTSHSGAPLQASGASGAMTADEILSIYKLQEHASVDSDKSRLKHLEAQARRDMQAVHATAISSFLTRLWRDMHNIRASDLGDYFRQLSGILSSDNRPFAIGLILAFIGITSIALSKVDSETF